MPSTNYPLAEVEHAQPQRKASQPTAAASALVAGAQPTVEAAEPASHTSSATCHSNDLELLDDELHPADSYYKGTYWADLPRAGASLCQLFGGWGACRMRRAASDGLWALGLCARAPLGPRGLPPCLGVALPFSFPPDRVKFAFWQSNKEAKRELGALWDMTKKVRGLPSQPCAAAAGLSRRATATRVWLTLACPPPCCRTRSRRRASTFRATSSPAWACSLVSAPLFTRELSPRRASALTGAWLTRCAEGSTLFSIGNLKPLFQAVWPACWSKHQTCDLGWINAIEYLEILGIIVGQVLVGFEGDWVGRKFGLVQNALIMTLGLVSVAAPRSPSTRSEQPS